MKESETAATKPPEDFLRGPCTYVPSCTRTHIRRRAARIFDRQNSRFPIAKAPYASPIEKASYEGKWNGRDETARGFSAGTMHVPSCIPTHLRLRAARIFDRQNSRFPIAKAPYASPVEKASYEGK